MKRILQLLLLLCATAAIARAGHTTIDGRLENSGFYPGTVHTFQITVPDSYDPSRPAALYVGLDGILCDAPAVIDSLSAAGIMPTTIGVFLQPGTVCDADGSVVRYNRSNEFDATDNRFVLFLEQELLPAVESMTTDDGRQIRFSRQPSERMIFGLSSGGIAAFNAAWHRPDMFGKVFSGCGTFVPMRGGNDLQAVVRKHEPLPLRVFLQDGYSDTWNPIFGSWYEANRLLASALEFAGYDCAFDWAEGGHSVARSSEIFPEVMTWMWRDYPAPAKAGPTGNSLLRELLPDGETWQAAPALDDSLYGGSEAFYPDSSLVAVANDKSNFIDQYIAGPDGSRICGQRFYWLHTYDNAPLSPTSMQFDAKGYLWVLTRAGVQICDQNGRVRGILRLPHDFDTDGARIAVCDGTVTITSRDGKTLARRLNCRRAVPGQRPDSEGSA